MSMRARKKTALCSVPLREEIVRLMEKYGDGNPYGAFQAALTCLDHVDYFGAVSSALKPLQYRAVVLPGAETDAFLLDAARLLYWAGAVLRSLSQEAH